MGLNFCSSTAIELMGTYHTTNLSMLLPLLITTALAPKPEVLIIALGWDGVTTPDDRIRQYKGCEIHILKNKEAIDLFNRLKQAGKRVAIHYHSTC